MKMTPLFSCLSLIVALQVDGVAAGDADASKTDARGNTPLHLAALRNDGDEVERLLQSGADPRAKNAAGATPLHYGAGSDRVVRLLLKAGADPNAVSAAGMRPLHSAAARPGSTGIGRQLLDAGAMVDAKCPTGVWGEFTALVFATLLGDESTVQLLLERGAAPGGKAGLTAVSAAAFMGNARLLETFLARGGEVNCDDGFTGHALNAAFYAGFPTIAAYLIEHGADLHQASSFGERAPPMVWAAYNESGELDVARRLLERGCDINEATSTGATALDWAAKRGETKLTEFLRAHGAKHGEKPLKRKPIPQNPVPEDPAARQQLVRDSVQRAIQVLQRSSDGFLRNAGVQRSGCVSCHQQTLPAAAFGRARERGFTLDEASLARQLKTQQASWSKTRDAAYEMFEPQPASAANLGFGLRGLHALHYEPDELTAAMVWYLAESQHADGSWGDFDRRPPLEGGRVVGTALAVSALRLYPQPPGARAAAEKIARARGWLEKYRPEDLNQRIFRLLGLGWAGAPPAELRSEVEAVKALQRPDGGWAPLPGLESDAWETGSTLEALHVAGGVDASEPVYQRGVAFLLRTQFSDGSWWVPSRTWPFQPHFDSGFPHGKDQWISAGGTAWAVIALLNTVEPVAAPSAFPTAQALIAGLEAAAAREVAAAPAGGKEAAASPEARREFGRDILPLFQRSCLGCHGGEKPRGQLRLDAREGLLKGGQSGEAAVVPGKAAESTLVRLVSDSVEDLEMPPKSRRSKYPALSPDEVRLVREWIDQGAK